MKIFLDCLPCLLRQALEASRRVTKNQDIQALIIEEAIKIISDYKKYNCSPEIAKDIHNIIKEITGDPDPYEAVKRYDIKKAEEVYPLLKELLAKENEKIYWALKIAATGNIIDSAIYGKTDFNKILEMEVKKEFSICDIEIFKKKLKSSKNILFIADNAGETIFDKILIEYLDNFETTYAVRSEPIINDATLKDAYDSGLNSFSNIISSGCAAPGTVPAQCNNEFLYLLEKADIVIAKGQGNFEALSDYWRPVFFLLKAKCPMIADRLNTDLDSYVFKYSGMLLEES